MNKIEAGICPPRLERSVSGESRLGNLESRAKVILIIMSIVSIAAACNKISSTPASVPFVYKSGTMTIGDSAVNIQVADTETLRTQGLSDRDSLDVDNGMIFIFQTPDQYAFWMKGMRFPLDFIWIKEGKVSQVTSNVPIQPGVAESNLTTYLPAEPIDSMLEVNAGWASAHGIKVGDSVVDHF